MLNEASWQMQMQYNGSQGNATSTGYAQAMKGGGVIPPVLLEESRVPRFYKDAIASCGAAAASQLPNTTAVYNLMVASGLPRPMLSYIWTIVNRTLPGQLTRQEFYSCLALIALAQKGQTLCALSLVSTLPVPQLQLPEPYSNQYKQTQPAGNSSVTASTPSLLFGPVSPSSSSQPPVAMPTSISVQNFGRQRFPSPAESAALSFTRSLDQRSSQRAATNIPSSEQAVSSAVPSAISPGGRTSLIKASQSIPAIVNFASSPAALPRPVASVRQPASSTLDDLFSSVDIKPDPSVPKASLEQPVLTPKPVPTSASESSSSKSSSRAVDMLNTIFDSSLPSTSSNSHKPTAEGHSQPTIFHNETAELKTIGQVDQEKFSSLLDDEFGEMTVPQNPTFVPVKDSLKSENDKIVARKPTIEKENPASYDVYAAVKMVEGGGSNREDTERIGLWKRCIDEAYSSFEFAEGIFLSCSKETVETVARTKRGSRYISALEKIFEMVTRISQGREHELAEKAERLDKINSVWERLKGYLYLSQTSPRTVSNGLIVKKCEICLSEIAEDALLEFAGNVYHKQCANFWINRIYPVLPKLS